MNEEEEINRILARMQDDKYLPGRGWNDIIIRCNRKLEMLDPEYRILQIKEKFGALRYYYETDVKIVSVKEAMDRYVRQAELESAKTCEFCGAEGKLMSRKMGWMKTRCTSCALTSSLEAMGL